MKIKAIVVDFDGTITAEDIRLEEIKKKEL